jgi:cellulose synthase/poly-beta-1,6-N-acetylglucosamine synthase-like glycosyltransferase
LIGILELVIWYTWPLRPSSKGKSGPREKNVTREASIVCATMNKSSALTVAAATWIANRPSSITIVADPDSFDFVQEQFSFFESDCPINVIRSAVRHKRKQLCQGFVQVDTPVIVIADDDTVWDTTVLENLVQPLLADKRLGCTFPDIRVSPCGSKFTIWELLGLVRLVGDGVDFHASRQIDGGVFCHHGCTAAYQGAILRDPNFIHAFTSETWRGNLLNSGDDQFLCCWLTNRGWPTMLLGADECMVQTRMRPNWRHMLQLLRWSRNDWRRSLSTLIWERHIWRSV